MTDLGIYLKSQLTASFAKTPTDYNDLYTQQFATRLTGTVMPPSPGVTSYQLNHRWTGMALEYDLNVNWHPAIKWLATKVEPWQITHRSRSAVIACSPLRVPENEQRLAKVKEWMPTYEKFTLSDETSDTLYQLIMDRTLEYFEFSPAWIKHYIKEHISSSLGQGYKWKNALSMDLDEWREIYETTRENIELLKAHSGDFLDIIFNTGSRARSPPLAAVQDMYVGEVERTRIIMFHAFLSLWNVFLPDKKSWYNAILQDVENMFHVSGKIFYPYTEGGNIYSKASELFEEGYRMHAYDGKSWESSVGTILGKAFHPLMVYLRGIYGLPSGISMTSLLGTVANVIVNANVDAIIIMLGDDMNYFVKGKLKGVPRVPWIGEEPEDSATRTILGASFWKPDAPRLTGFKVMSDRADKQLPIRLTRDWQSVEMSPKRDPRERAAWFGMYLGYYGDGTLISQLRKEKIETLDFYAPRLTIQSLVQDPSADAFAWAEREGVKKLLVE